MQEVADVFSITQSDLGALSIDVVMGGNSTISTFL